MTTVPSLSLRYFLAYHRIGHAWPSAYGYRQCRCTTATCALARWLLARVCRTFVFCGGKFLNIDTESTSEY